MRTRGAVLINVGTDFPFKVAPDNKYCMGVLKNGIPRITLMEGPNGERVPDDIIRWVKDEGNEYNDGMAYAPSEYMADVLEAKMVWLRKGIVVAACPSECLSCINSFFLLVSFPAPVCVSISSSSSSSFDFSFQ